MSVMERGRVRVVSMHMDVIFFMLTLVLESVSDNFGEREFQEPI